MLFCTLFCVFFFFNDTATTEIYTLSLHDALPISVRGARGWLPRGPGACRRPGLAAVRQLGGLSVAGGLRDLRVPPQSARPRARGRERRAADPFRHGYGHATRGFRAGGRRRDRRRLARS